MKEEASKRVRYGYLLEEIVKAEKIKVTEEDVDKRLSEIAKEYKIEKDKVLTELNVSREDFKYNIEMEKAIEVLKENN